RLPVTSGAAAQPSLTSWVPSFMGASGNCAQSAADQRTGARPPDGVLFGPYAMLETRRPPGARRVEPAGRRAAATAHLHARRYAARLLHHPGAGVVGRDVLRSPRRHQPDRLEHPGLERHLLSSAPAFERA